MNNLYKHQAEIATIKLETSENQSTATLKLEKQVKEIDCYGVPISSDIVLPMIKIIGDRFVMGTPEEEIGRSQDETPEHEVKINDFFVSQYLITQSQYTEVMKENPSIFKGENHPVENVSWYKARDFCLEVSRITNKSFRLLSEAEWEYVCRAGTKTSFCFGETITSELANYKACFGYGEGSSGKWREQTTPVGFFPANNFGLYDVHGNVWEWCADYWHENYQDAPNDGQVWQDTPSTKDHYPRVIRGGSWDDTAYYCRCGVRLWALPNFKGQLIGFRVACDLL